MSMSMIGMAHAGVGCVALVAGGAVLTMAKGTSRHRLLGRIYAAAVLVINGSALTIYDMSGRPNVFHAIALVNLPTLMLGLRALRQWRRTRDPVDLETHRRRMAMNYVGLWMAFVTELLVNPMLGVSRLGDPRGHWPLMIVLNLGLLFAGRWLVLRQSSQSSMRA